MMRGFVRRTIALGIPWLVGGCSGWQSALDPHGAQATRLSNLIWLVIAVCAAVWGAVMIALIAAIGRKRTPRPSPLAIDPQSQRAMTRAVVGGVAATVGVITVLTLVSFFTTRSLSSSSSDDDVAIQVLGHQWWWEVTYLHSGSDQGFVTANEIHVPVGRRVRVRLLAADVIHSFWVPNLTGKLDLIPGRRNEIAFTAQQAGIYRGQCAEFCGLQHAHMAFLVIAEEPGAFAAWRKAEADGAAAPVTDEQSAGRRIFDEKACAACHTVRGTSASGTNGPDLTHVGSRRYIAAGLMETTRGSLAAWIADPQNLKPGNAMPMVPLSAGELKAVSAYLASLR